MRANRVFVIGEDSYVSLSRAKWLVTARRATWVNGSVPTIELSEDTSGRESSTTDTQRRYWSAKSKVAGMFGYELGFGMNGAAINRSCVGAAR